MSAWRFLARTAFAATYAVGGDSQWRPDVPDQSLRDAANKSRRAVA